MGDLQKKLTKIAELCSRDDFTTEELFKAFEFEKDSDKKNYDSEDVFKSLSLKIGKEIYNNICLLFVCFYLRKNLRGNKDEQLKRQNG